MENEKVYLVINKSDEVKAVEVLKENEILIEGIYFSPIDIFADEEAAHRINLYEEVKNIEIPEDKKQLIYERLSDEYSDTSNYMDEESLSDIQYEVIEDILQNK